MKPPISSEERERISSTIAEIEKSTIADLDVVVVRVSDRYSLYPLVWASAAGLAVAAIVAFAYPRIGSRETIATQFALAILLIPILQWLPIRLRLVPRIVKYAQARQMAHREFAAQNAAAANGRPRILFFVSVGERYVEIIADHEIDSKVSQETWDGIIADFAKTMQSERVAVGLIKAIKKCGGVLQTHCPK